MPEIFLPIVMGGQPPTPPKRVVIDPITRIEGHLRIEVQVENGVVTDAWSAGTMFRGIETVLIGRDPREAWLYAQRICGVCTTVHSIASVRAVENALNITIPDNARIIRNLLEGSQFIQDHVMHFYHLHALDWVDIVSALSADPTSTSDLQKSISPNWDPAKSSPAYFGQVKTRLNNFVNSGQLGLFANGYWGNAAYRLSREENLLAAAHYLEALLWQREYIKFHAILGGKSPHPQTYLVGGMASPVDPASPSAINNTRVAQLVQLSTDALQFVAQVYIPDLLMVARKYKDWADLGGGRGHLLAYGDFPNDTSGAVSALWMPQGIVVNPNPGNAFVPQVQTCDQKLITEYVSRSWYTYTDGSAAKHPDLGETNPNYTGPTPPYDFLTTEGKYSWLKAPRYSDIPMEVGPLARMVVAYYSGGTNSAHVRVKTLVDQVLGTLGLEPGALISTLGRVAARGIETQVIAEKMSGWLTELENNIKNGNLTIHNGARWDPQTWPATAAGWGTTEAPRGGLGHWVHIQNGKIQNYQCIVPTTWNGSPRDARGQRGAWEQALIGTPMPDPSQPVELLRTIHSFDPCMGCAVHIVDSRGHEMTRIKVE